MITFNKPAVVGMEYEYISNACKNGHLSGDGEYSKLCTELLQERFGTLKALLTTSCTHALEMCALLLDLKEGDEVIMPSYTFVSTANAFVLRGVQIVFVDIRPDTMNIDEKLIEKAITPKTRAIVPVHYAGVACEMDEIMRIARKHKLIVIEDAAQAITSEYKGKQLGTIGHLGCFSFHETKNVQCGEGGALLINEPEFIERAEIIREKGTNRSKFFRGSVDKYSWVDLGSSYLLSDLNAAFLYAQLQKSLEIKANRMHSWNQYQIQLNSLVLDEKIKVPNKMSNEEHNAHMFQIKVKDLNERTALLKFLKEKGIMAVFHYVPLHTSEAGIRYGRLSGEDKYTTTESERLIRLPLYYDLKEEDSQRITASIKEFFYEYIN